MTRDRLVWLLALVGLVLCAWWLSANTEWVDDDRPRPASGEARDNPVYAAEHLLRRLGMHVEHHEALEVMPPPQARLVLLSNSWELIPERAEQLHEWVEQGGHLVLLQANDWDDTALGGWVPIEAAEVKDSEWPEPPARRASGVAVPATKPETENDHLSSSPPLWGSTESIETCGSYMRWYKKLLVDADEHPAWTLTRVAAPQTQQALRVPVGKGSVTVLNSAAYAFYNRDALKCDTPVLLAAALQAEPGATAWIYLDEKREALMPWLWHRGWIALLMVALAIAAALWRAAVPFGPRLAAAPRLRRSISEQVRGLGAYLQSGGREALLVAQQRALHEVATRVLPRYARLPLAERVHALAEATGLLADDLTTALNSRACTRAELPQRLQLLETARRRLHRTPDERPTP